MYSAAYSGITTKYRFTRFWRPVCVLAPPKISSLGGIPDTNTGFSNWKKQHSIVKNHEMSAVHSNAKVAEVLFLKEKTITSCMERQEQDEAAQRKLKVTRNRNVMRRVVDSIIYLGKQGLSFRGHRESLGSEVLNTGKFLELLKYLSVYNVTIRDHLEKIRHNHEEMRKSQTKEVKIEARNSHFSATRLKTTSLM